MMLALQRRNLSFQRLGNLPKVTQLGSGEQACLTPEAMLFATIGGFGTSAGGEVKRIYTDCLVDCLR